MRLPRFDVVFSLAAPAVDILVKDTGVARFQIGDDEACVGPFRADFDACDNPLDVAPARGPVEELLEAARCVSSRSAAANSMKIFCSMRGWIGILFNPQHAHSHSET